MTVPGDSENFDGSTINPSLQAVNTVPPWPMLQFLSQVSEISLRGFPSVTDGYLDVQDETNPVLQAALVAGFTRALETLGLMESLKTMCSQVDVSKLLLRLLLRF